MSDREEVVGGMASVLRTPRPVPVFFNDSPFSQRKRTPFRAPQPPRAPSKSCPPVSRVFPTPNNGSGGSRPQFVSFKSERKPLGFTSPVYDAASRKSYFEQCFEILEKLGEGSFGEVFKVRCKEDGKLYAVKRSRQSFRGEWDRRQKLEEVEKQEWLPPHPNCVQFHRAWEERQHLYIQTELCQMSLAEYADLHGRIPEHRVWGFLIDLARGLKHLHAHRLCHLDIKPANIFLGHDGSCKLGDFGLCVSLDQGLGEATEGDAKYLAPELMEGRFGKPADIFSLGISLLEVSCDLELPSGGPNWHLLREGRLPEEITRGLSPHLLQILTRLMQMDPLSRPSADDILQDWHVQRAVHKYALHKLCDRMVRMVRSVFSKVYGGFLTILLLLAYLFPAVRRSDNQKQLDSVEFASSHLRQDDSFSDDEDELMREFGNQSSDEGGDPQAKFNCSWMHSNSPMKYPSPVYTGPPIPLDFGDTSTSSLDNSASSEEPHPHYLRGSPRVAATTFDLSFGSHNSSFSYTPSTNPSLEEAQLRKKNISIGPKNLMDIFDEAKTGE